MTTAKDRLLRKNRNMAGFVDGGEVLASLFANNEQGFVDRLGRKSVLFQNSSLTTPVSTSGDKIGAVKDASPRGKNAIQPASANRPTFVEASTPYALFDAVAQEYLQTTFVPGAAITMVLSWRQTNPGNLMFGGGNATAGKRAYIGLDGSGFVNIGYGTAVNQGATSRTGQDVIVLFTTDGLGTPSVRINGVDVAWGAFTGSPDGSGGGFVLGAFNNNGTPSNFASGRTYFALALDRKLTQSEITLVERSAQEVSPPGLIPS